MTVRILAFARIREIVGAATLERPLQSGARIADVFAALASEFPALRELGSSTRFVRDGAFVAPDTTARDGDEIGLLPPFGGG